MSENYWPIGGGGGASIAHTTDPLKGDGAGDGVAATSTDIAGLFTGVGTYLKSDGSKGTPSGSGTVTHTPGPLTANAVILGNSAADVKAGAVLPADATKYLNGTGAFTVPSGGGGGSIGPSASCFQSGQILATNVLVAITFAANDWDTGSIHDTVVNPTHFTAPSTGFYQATFGVVNIGGGTLELTFNLNGATPPDQIAGFFPNLAGISAGSISRIYRMNATDFLEGMAISGGSPGTTANCFMQLTKLTTTF
jgi:hypothetical protein